MSIDSECIVHRGPERRVGLMVNSFVPQAVAGAALTGFSGGLVGMYLRTPALHKPGSIWPTQQGIGVSKDVWLLGIGTSLVIDDVASK